MTQKRNKTAYLKSNDQGVCPLCGSFALDYDSPTIDGEVVDYSWTCENCGATGKESYDLIFATHRAVNGRDMRGHNVRLETCERGCDPEYTIKIKEE